MKLARNVGLIIFVGVCILMIALTVQQGFEEANQTSSSMGGETYLANVGSSPTPMPTATIPPLDEPDLAPTASPIPGPTPTYDMSTGE